MSIPALDELELLHRNMCYALSDPRRMQILYALHAEPQHVNALVDKLGIPQSTLSRALNILKQRNLVNSTRNGNMIIYELTDTRIISVMDTMRAMLSDLLQEQAQMTGTHPKDQGQ